MYKCRLFGMLILLILIVNGPTVMANGSGNTINKSKDQTVSEFYELNFDKNDYEEFPDAKLKVRKLILVKDLVRVFDSKEWLSYPSEWRNMLKREIGGNTRDLNPEQQVYYFFSLKDDGKKIYKKHALYDVKTKNLHLKGNGNWTKEEFKLKFKE
ncbi:hypothetical protein ACQCVH_24295 [Bacillus infantis]|uniref:hypothetical protein n=1 Tax=Bacillus infantis TaxID=324767 RepID=UPI003CF5FE17